MSRYRGFILRIRIVTAATFPDGQAATSRIRCYAKALATEGHELMVVSPGNQRTLPGPKVLLSGKKDGIGFVLLRNFNVSRGVVSRYIWPSIEPITLVFHTAATMRDSDVFVIYLNTTLSRFILIVLLRLFGKKVVVELNEYPYATEGSRFHRLPFVRPCLRRFVLRIVFPLANGFIVISESLRQVVVRYAPNAVVFHVPILGERLPTETALESNAHKDVYLFHAGSLSEQKDGILTVFEAFVRAHCRLWNRHGIRLKFYLTSTRTQPKTWNTIIKLLAQHELAEDVVVTGFCSEDALARYLQDALALVINKPTNIQNQHNFPTKLGAYLASSTPVILAAEGTEANHYLKDGVNAIIIEPNDVEGIADAVVRCFEDREMAQKIVRNAVETYTQYFHYVAHAGRLSEFMRAL